MNSIELYEKYMILTMQSIGFVSMALSMMYYFSMEKEKVTIFDLMRYVNLVILMFLFATLFDSLIDSFNYATSDIKNSVLKELESFDKVRLNTGKCSYLLAALSNQLFLISTAIAGIIVKCSMFFQIFFKYFIKIMAPLLIGLSCWKMFSGLLSKLIMNTVWLCLWACSFVIADVSYLKIMNQLAKSLNFNSEMSGAILYVNTFSFIFYALTIGLFALLLYCMAPIFMYKILNGKDITSVVTDAGKITAQVVSGAVRGASAISSLKTGESGNMNIGGVTGGTPTVSPMPKIDNVAKEIATRAKGK